MVKRRYPNQSVLSFITGEEKEADPPLREAGIKKTVPILFVCVKPGPDFKVEEKIYWVRNGEPSIIWDELEIRHWLAFATDAQIATEYERLLSDRYLDIGKRRLVLAEVSRALEASDYSKVLPTQRAETLIIADPGLLPPAFCHKENLAALSGYRSGQKEIRPIRPAGFYAPDFLFERFSKNIIGYCQRRSPHLNFRGVRSTLVDGVGSTELTGFYQENFSTGDQFTVAASNANLQEIGKADVSLESGLFKMSLIEPSSEGIIQVLRQSEIVYEENFTLLQSINGSINMTEKTFKDAYGRVFPLYGNEVKRPATILGSTWYGQDYAKEKTADIHLSDKFKELIDYLGPSVMISDPYFLGPFRGNKAVGGIKLSRDQVAFLAALLRSVVDGSVKELYILGYNARANDADRKSGEADLSIKEARFKDYKDVFDQIFVSNKLQSFKSGFNIHFLNNRRDIHGRYWFKIDEINGTERLDRCVILTNSLGNIDEVDINPVEEPQQLRELTARYLGFFNNSDQELAI
jgi:hypothetical protein